MNTLPCTALSAAKLMEACPRQSCSNEGSRPLVQGRYPGTGSLMNLVLERRAHFAYIMSGNYAIHPFWIKRQCAFRQRSKRSAATAPVMRAWSSTVRPAAVTPCAFRYVFARHSVRGKAVKSFLAVRARSIFYPQPFGMSKYVVIKFFYSSLMITLFE